MCFSFYMSSKFGVVIYKLYLDDHYNAATDVYKPQ